MSAGACISVLFVLLGRLELEAAQRDKQREREAWEREMRDMREMEIMEKMKHEMELKLPGLCHALVRELFVY